MQSGIRNCASCAGRKENLSCVNQKNITIDEAREKATVDISWSRVRYDNRGNATSWGGDWDRLTIERRNDEWIIISARARIPTNAELK